MLGIALGEAQYALLELKTFGLARVEIAESHIESVVALFDELLKNTAWGRTGRATRQTALSPRRAING
jgi:hypothetical protein